MRWACFNSKIPCKRKPRQKGKKGEMRKPDYKPLHAGQVLREFAKCFKDKNLRVRYPYAMIERDTIIATDSYMILKYQHHMPIIDGTVHVKLDHAAQFSSKDDLILDGEHLQGTASGLIIPAHREPVKLFGSVKGLFNREQESFINNPEPVSYFRVSSELLSNVIGAFDRLGFNDAELHFNTASRPMSIGAIRNYRQSGSTVTAVLEGMIVYRA